MDYFLVLLGLVAFLAGMLVSLGIATLFNDKHVDRMKKLNNYRMLAEYNLGQAKNALSRFDKLIEELGSEGQTLVKFTQVSRWVEAVKRLDLRTSELETELIERITDSRKVAAVTQDYSLLNSAASTLYDDIAAQNGKIQEQTNVQQVGESLQIADQESLKRVVTSLPGRPD